MTLLRAVDAAQAREIVGWAAGVRQPLEIVAGGSKRALGRATHTDHVLDVSALSGIVAYEPAELVLTARAATPMAEIDALLRASRQMLSFEPPDWRGLLGGSGAPTLGGVLACNLAGPRRVKAGSARDYLLGFAGVNGRGEAWKAGGKVVKNVTGYDMCKLQTGAFGTLSLLTEVTLKVMPRPETACTLLLADLSEAAAIVLLARALNTPYEVSGALHLPATAAARSGMAAVCESRGPVTALRLEGPAPSVAFRAQALEQILGPAQRLDDGDTARFWHEAGNVTPLLDAAGRHVWRICTAPSAAPAAVDAIRARFAGIEVFYDWGGGLVWLGIAADEAGADAGAVVVRHAISPFGGHATLIAAPQAMRETVPVFQPLPGALAALGARIKSGFDPHAVLNPGRMQEGQ